MRVCIQPKIDKQTNDFLKLLGSRNRGAEIWLDFCSDFMHLEIERVKKVLGEHAYDQIYYDIDTDDISRAHLGSCVAKLAKYRDSLEQLTRTQMALLEISYLIRRLQES